MELAKIDEDGDGHVSHQEMKNFLPHLPDDELKKEIRKSDRNKDGKLDRHEFRHMMERRAMRFAKLVVLPKNERDLMKRDQVDGEYEDQFSCCPPPIFMLSISLVIIGIFIYHTNELVKDRGWILGLNGPPPITSVLIYNPYRRYEYWRYFTYMFVHSGWMHITSNVIMQLFLGILLELVHKWWRVGIVYICGVIAGSLATSLSDPEVFLAGASGGVYALIAAHLATVIMNWKQMEMPWVQVVCITAFSILDVGTALYYRYVTEEEQKVGYVAHIGGALAGLLVGIYTLKNLHVTTWEKWLWWAMLIISTILFVFAICWNIFYDDYYLPPKYDN
ncbi:rhomboid-related protein 3 isoform X2 [Folsomia candida]|uniref:rhomboid-related protein 3 isoform X2 n=1 Tax=Folsomia candida TaxID=158441 RepID=UPI000B903BA9|nr:rhomboid-related protein 3 isoform X2 [Folsomia candida]